MSILYNLRRTSDGFMLAKFGPDFNVEAVYHLTTSFISPGAEFNPTNLRCDCPAGGRPSCKHRKMLSRMIPKADSDEFYCYETQSWHKPLAPKWEEPMQDKLDAFYATIEEVASEAGSEPTDKAYKAMGPDPLGETCKDKTITQFAPSAEPPTFRRRV